jgi:hypothetical protein
VQVESRLLRETSVASAYRVPDRAAFRKEMFAWIATTALPPVFAAMPKAKSARVKIAPPCTVPRLFRCRSSIGRLVLA